MRFPGFLLVAIVATAPLSAQQPARVYGVIVDSSSGKPLLGAEVSLGEEARITSAAGYFGFGSVPFGVLRLKVRALGFNPQDRRIDILPGSDQRIDLRLVPMAIELDSVVVRADREASLSGAELERRGSTLATALDGWEGVVVSRTGAGNEAVPQVRGSAPDEVLVLVDGFPANSPFTGRADLSRFHSRDIARVSLEKGAQTARVGSRAVAGVISVETRRGGNSEAGFGAGSFGALESMAALAGSAGRLSVTAEALPDGFAYQSPSGLGELERKNAGGSVYTLNGRVGHPADFTVRASVSDRGLPGTSKNPTPDAHAQDYYAFLGARTGDKLQVSATAEWLSTEAKDHNPPPGFISYDGTTRGWGGSASASLRQHLSLLGWRGDLNWGLDARHDGFNGSAVVPGAHFTRGGVGVGAQLERTAGAAIWSLAPAFRVEWWTGRKDPALSARLDARWLQGGTRLNVGAGSSITAPALADILFREDVGIKLNPGLRPERVRWEMEAGIGQQFTLGSVAGDLRLNTFWGRVEDLILWTPDFRFVWSPGNFDVVRRGGELAADFQLTRNLLISGGSNLSIVTNDRPGGAQVRYRPRYTHYGLLQWTPDPWRFSVRWHHVGVRFSTNVGTQPLPAVDLLGLGVERQLGRMLTLHGEVRDLLDQRPSYIAGFPAPGRSFLLSLNLEFP